jgi:predicted ATPase
VSDGPNQWYVITGPPCCGKSTTVELLARRGFRVRSEIARAYVDEEISRGREIQEIRSDMTRLQCEVLRRALASEKELPREELIFFDRGIPDSLAYFKLHGMDTRPYIDGLRSSRYRLVFYLEPWGEYHTDYARLESSGERDQLARLIWETYNDLGFRSLRVPALDRQQRVDYILARIS